MMKFSMPLSEFVKKSGDKCDLAVKSIMVDMIRKIDLRSPVGQPEIWAENVERKAKGLPINTGGYVGGRFRGNWQLGIGSIPSGVIDGVDPSGSRTVGKNIALIPDKAAGLQYFYTNNLPYAQRLEDGWSYKQAPLGIVGITVMEFSSIVDTNVRQVAS